MAEVEIEDVQLFCFVCGTLVPEEEVPEFNGSPRVDGDWFFRAMCSKCNKGKANIERLPMTWQEVTHFAIYQLTLASEKNIFFRWREDICNLIDSHWDYLIPSKKRTPTWQSTVASTLSTSNDVFLNGFEQNNKQQGWWALVDLAPPKPKVTKETVPKKRSVKSDAGLEGTPASKDTESAKRHNGEGTEGQSIKRKKQAGTVDSSTPGAAKRKHEKDGTDEISAKKIKPTPAIAQQIPQSYPTAHPQIPIHPPPMGPVYTNQMPPNSIQPTGFITHQPGVPMMATIPIVSQQLSTNHMQMQYVSPEMPAHHIPPHPFATGHQIQPALVPTNQMPPQGISANYVNAQQPTILVTTNQIAQQTIPPNQISPGAPVHRTVTIEPTPPMSKEMKLKSGDHGERSKAKKERKKEREEGKRRSKSAEGKHTQKADDGKDKQPKSKDKGQKLKNEEGKTKERAEGKERTNSEKGKRPHEKDDGKDKKKRDEGRSKEREKERSRKHMVHEGKVKETRDEKRAKETANAESEISDVDYGREEKKKKPKKEDGITVKKSEEGKETTPKVEKDRRERKDSKTVRDGKEKKESKKLKNGNEKKESMKSKDGKASKERRGAGEQSGGEEASKKTKKQKSKPPKADSEAKANSDLEESEYEEEVEGNEGTWAEAEKTETGTEKKTTRKKPLKLMGEREEGQILQLLLAFPHQLHGPISARLRQKLLIRQCKRKRGLPLFDLDKTVRQMIDFARAYENKEPVPYGRKEDLSPKKRKTPQAGADTETSGPGLVVGRGAHILDRYQARYRQGMTEEAQKSFRAMLAGMTQAEEETGLRPIKSPFTERMLKPFIRRDFETIPARLQLLEDIVQYPNRNNPRWTPPPQWPIDYCYVRPFHIAACNALCQDVFWPGIDVSECLGYPDFTVVALYKKLVIGCAFMTPEAYITYIVVHPQWRGHGISSFMLYHLLQTCAGKDVTLHVSATNPAMILYQSFGFKVEEYIIGFYDKYYPEDSKECKNAFFMRLRR